MITQLFHRPRFHSVYGKVAVFDVAFQQALAFQKAAGALGNHMGQLRELLAGRCLGECAKDIFLITNTEQKPLQAEDENCLRETICSLLSTA